MNLILNVFRVFCFFAIFGILFLLFQIKKQNDALLLCNQVMIEIAKTNLILNGNTELLKQIKSIENLKTNDPHSEDNEVFMKIK